MTIASRAGSPGGLLRAPRVGRRREMLAWTERHPLWVVAALAAATRLVAVVVLGPLREGVAVPDEGQYLDLAASVAAGRGAEAWFPGYGATLYDTTATFVRPLSALTWLFGSHQLVGQFLAATFGVVTAVATAAVASRLVRPKFAVIAGLFVALLPSQVYWSSVVLRESMIWASLAGLALIVAAASSAATGRRTAWLGIAAFCTLYALCDLRQHTALVAAWSLVLVSLLTRAKHRVLIPTGAVFIALIVPALTGLGVGGYTLVERVVPELGIIRAKLSVDAASSIVDRTPVLPPVAGETGPSADPVPAPSTQRGIAVGPPTGQEPEVPPEDAAPRVSGAPRRTTGPRPPPVDAPSVAPGTVIITARDGQQYVVEDSGTGLSLSTLPSGLVASALRPFPWEPAESASVLLAKAENVIWAALYVLAAAGALITRRRADVVAFPVLVVGGVLVTAAISQGNLGTAFRHRGQILWALAVLSVVALQYVTDRRLATRT